MHNERRQSKRFPSEEGTTAHIDLNSDHTQQSFQVDLVALVYEEALKGCGLIVLTANHLQVGDKCLIQVGPDEPHRAEVRWRKELDTNVFKLGCMYLD